MFNVYKNINIEIKQEIDEKINPYSHDFHCSFKKFKTIYEN